MNTNQTKMLLTAVFVIVFTFVAPQARANSQTICNSYVDSVGNTTLVCDTNDGPSDSFGKPYNPNEIIR